MNATREDSKQGREDCQCWKARDPSPDPVPLQRNPETNRQTEADIPALDVGEEPESVDVGPVEKGDEEEMEETEEKVEDDVEEGAVVDDNVPEDDGVESWVDSVFDVDVTCEVDVGGLLPVVLLLLPGGLDVDVGGVEDGGGVEEALERSGGGNDVVVPPELEGALDEVAFEALSRLAIWTNEVARAALTR